MQLPLARDATLRALICLSCFVLALCSIFALVFRFSTLMLLMPLLLLLLDARVILRSQAASAIKASKSAPCKAAKLPLQARKWITLIGLRMKLAVVSFNSLSAATQTSRLRATRSATQQQLNPLTKQLDRRHEEQ